MGESSQHPSRPHAADGPPHGRSKRFRQDSGPGGAGPCWPAWLLRRADQGAVAVLVLFALLGVIGWWVSQGGLHGRLVEFEQAKPQEAQFLVDVNTADWPELAQLPGIGETLARRIVAVRESSGPFRDFEDLRVRVRGIGPATLERIRPHLVPIPRTDGLAKKKGTGAYIEYFGDSG